mmetsp:Transcript_9231/g.40336  ORF Transcript_9231/g.40336 Transcript_9231/m.40336 type:complete len:273 (+) Transcript_9231:3027-3845(+)
MGESFQLLKFWTPPHSDTLVVESSQVVASSRPHCLGISPVFFCENSLTSYHGIKPEHLDRIVLLNDCELLSRSLIVEPLGKRALGLSIQLILLLHKRGFIKRLRGVHNLFSFREKNNGKCVTRIQAKTIQKLRGPHRRFRLLIFHKSNTRRAPILILLNRDPLLTELTDLQPGTQELEKLFILCLLYFRNIQHYNRPAESRLLTILSLALQTPRFHHPNTHTNPETPQPPPPTPTKNSSFNYSRVNPRFTKPLPPPDPSSQPSLNPNTISPL